MEPIDRCIQGNTKGVLFTALERNNCFLILETNTDFPFKIAISYKNKKVMES